VKHGEEARSRQDAAEQSREVDERGLFNLKSQSPKRPQDRRRKEVNLEEDGFSS